MKTEIKLFILIQLFTVGVYAQSNYIGPGISAEIIDGTNNYIDLGDVYNSLNFPVTFESWVFPTGFDSIYSALFGSDSKNTGNYYGFHVRFNTSGNLGFEIGDGTGAGSTDRRGKATTTSVPLNSWTHIAVVATSVTDIKFYFNGILQPAVNTDGGSAAINMVHNTNPAEIARYMTIHDSHNFIGEMDDVRLWNIGRSEVDVRSNMCHKLTGLESNLIGYWSFDESYVSSSINDFTTPQENGSIIGAINKLTSSAPIGDVSTYQYNVDWSGVSLLLSSPGGDKLKVNKILNTPAGVHLYRVNSSPYYINGLTNFTPYYYGVFTINGLLSAKYTATYIYSMGNGVVTLDNEISSGLYVRNSAANDTWFSSGAVLNIDANKLTKKNVMSMKEFIFNVNDPGEPRFSGDYEKDNNVNIYPNPASNLVTVTNIESNSTIYLVNVLGGIVHSGISMGGNYSISVEGIPAGLYFIYSNNLNNYLGKVIIQ